MKELKTLQIKSEDELKQLLENSKIEFGFCNTSINTEKAMKSPVFFMENTNENKNRFVINMPTPSDCALYVYNEIYKPNIEDLYEIGICDFRKRKNTNSMAFTEILIDRFLNVIKVNICAVFKNGLFDFLSPYFKYQPKSQYSSLFNYEPSDKTIELIYSALVNNKPESGVLQAAKIITLFARELGNWYFDFINQLLFKDLYKKDELCKELADSCDIKYESIDEKQKYMFITNCLLELAKIDIHKDLEIVEINAMNLVHDFYKEYQSGISSEEDTK